MSLAKGRLLRMHRRSKIKHTRITELEELRIAVLALKMREPSVSNDSREVDDIVSMCGNKQKSVTLRGLILYLFDSGGSVCLHRYASES